MLDRQLHEILREVMGRADSDFSGIGLILTDRPEQLPLYPLRLGLPVAIENNLVSQLIEISSLGSIFHDGFHVVSTAWRIVLVSQYFSPSILPNVSVDRSRRFGGRYMAALFGSALPNVIATGIASRGFGVAVFCNGSEATYEADL